MYSLKVIYYNHYVIQVDSNLVEQLKVIVAEKERKVHDLEDELKQLKLAVSSSSHVRLNHTSLMPQFSPYSNGNFKNRSIAHYLYCRKRKWPA